MRRRDFITLLGGAAVGWPLTAQAQQTTIGLLNGVSNESYAERIAAVRAGLKEAGFVEGQNLAIEYRSADGQYDRLPALAADLVNRRVAVIVAIGSTSSVQAAKAATSTIPVVFAFGGDPIRAGVVASLSRPGANVTGVAFDNVTLLPKRLELIRELLPKIERVGFLVNQAGVAVEAEEISIPAAARTIGIQFSILKASTESEIDAALASAAQQDLQALVVSNDAYINSRRDQIIALAAHYALPTVYGVREAVAAGGLMSYTPKVDELYREAGHYVGRILKGAKPADLPVVLPTKFELVINGKTAKALSIELPLPMLMRVDEVID